MPDPISYLELSYRVLSKSELPLSPKEIWDEAITQGIAEDLTPKTERPWYSIRSTIERDINQNTQSHFCISEETPDKYTLKKSLKRANIEVNATPSKLRIYEKDLHEILCAFVAQDSHFNCKIKTIHENKGQNTVKGSNKWAYPDMVGIYIPEIFEKTTVILQKELSVCSYRFFSFELKKELSINNLRECYFQAVSNSSWAHEGYLVTLDIVDNDDSVDNEMALLNSSYGIGIIKLNPKDIVNSKILYPCQPGKSLDWLMINKLVKNNKDFREFIEDVTLLVKNERGEVRFDPPKDIDDLQEKLKQYFF